MSQRLDHVVIAVRDAVADWLGCTARNSDAGNASHPLVVRTAPPPPPAPAPWGVYALLAQATLLLAPAFLLAPLSPTPGLRPLRHYLAHGRRCLM